MTKSKHYHSDSSESEYEQTQAFKDNYAYLNNDIDTEKLLKYKKRLLRAISKNKGTDVIAKYKNKLRKLSLTDAQINSLIEEDESGLADDLNKEYYKGETTSKIKFVDGVGVADDEKKPAVEIIPGTVWTGGEVPEGYIVAKNGKIYAKPPPPPPSSLTLMLFYMYCWPLWTVKERDETIEFFTTIGERLGIRGRARISIEGTNCTLIAPTPEKAEEFCEALRNYNPHTRNDFPFKNTDFKKTVGLRENQQFKFLKVFPVVELVNYGFSFNEAVVGNTENAGIHLKPQEWTEMSRDPDACMIDIRNFNETAIGRFVPEGAEYIDPMWRRSTEIKSWLKENIDYIKTKKKCMIFCTAGIRCSRLSYYLKEQGIENVYQLEGGIERYLKAYPVDGGIWKGKNYTFDRRFSHGAEQEGPVIGRCVACDAEWERYQARCKCSRCKLEILVCRDCQRSGVPSQRRLICPLCKNDEERLKSGTMTKEEIKENSDKVKAFAASGGRDGEGEGALAEALDDEPTSGKKRPFEGGHSKPGRGSKSVNGITYGNRRIKN